MVVKVDAQRGLAFRSGKQKERLPWLMHKGALPHLGHKELRGGSAKVGTAKRIVNLHPVLADTAVSTGLPISGKAVG